jgi:Tol biopolymer transport system component
MFKFAASVLMSLLAVGGGVASAASTERVTVASGGGQADQLAFTRVALSDNGQVAAFNSRATNLVAGDTNSSDDTFVRDRRTGVTERVSVSSTGEQGTASSIGWPSISADGRYVAFASYASNLVPGDTNNAFDVFLRDRVAGTTKRVSVSAAGVQGNFGSVSPSISADGSYIAFRSYASNLVSGDTGGFVDVFVVNRQTGAIERVNVSSAGVQANSDTDYPGITSPQLSADGRFVAFESQASNLVAGDGNGVSDVFVRDRQSGTTTRVSVDTAGGDPNGPSTSAVISGDGDVVGFLSDASDLVAGDTNGFTDAFARYRTTNRTRRASVTSAGANADGPSWSVAISRSGNRVAFGSSGENLVPGDTNHSEDVFVRDRAAGTTTRVSLTDGGAQSDRGATTPSISGNGRVVSFISRTTDLVAGDTNGVADGFVREDDPPDPYLDAEASGSAGVLDPMYAFGPPDGRFALIVHVGSEDAPYATFDFGDDEQGLGNVEVTYAPLSADLGTTATLLDAYGNVLASSPITFSAGSLSLGTRVVTVPYTGTTPYRYIRFTATLLSALIIDAARAQYVV